MSKKILSYIILFGVFILPIVFLIKLKFFSSKEKVSENVSRKENLEELKEALFWEDLGEGKVQCNLCPNKCILEENQWGLCKARKNIEGKLYSMVYGRTTSVAIDPIEKKPFYHFLPGQKAYSLATSGCNLACFYCQNWDIAQRFPDDLQSKYKTPEEIVKEVKESDAPIVAFTYNEPIVWYEYMLEIARLAKKEGLKTVMVSNGYINKEPLLQLIPFMDALKIDLKGFNEDYYREVVGGRLEPVLETLKTLKESSIHYEIVTLLVTGKNDSEEEIKKECLWIKENLGADVPLHFSRFYPMYKMENIPATPEETIKKARKICLDIGLKYVYTGNIVDLEGSTTFCPQDNKPLIVRKGYFVQENLVDEKGRSEECPGEEIPGVWE